jgi:hypothetical protein
VLTVVFDVESPDRKTSGRCPWILGFVVGNKIDFVPEKFIALRIGKKNGLH